VSQVRVGPQPGRYRGGELLIGRDGFKRQAAWLDRLQRPGVLPAGGAGGGKGKGDNCRYDRSHGNLLFAARRSGGDPDGLQVKVPASMVRNRVGILTHHGIIPQLCPRRRSQATVAARMSPAPPPSHVAQPRVQARFR
jgi:hypothetical protein